MNLSRLRKLAGIYEKLTADDFEKVMFGDLKGSNEKDTDAEAEAYDALEAFFNDPSKANKSDLVTLLKQLKSLKQTYPNDLIPKASFAYRGTQLHKRGYKTLLKAAQQSSNRASWIEVDHTYTPKSEIQSWTTNRDVGIQFALHLNRNDSSKKYSPKRPYPILIKVPVDDSFIMSAKLTNLFDLIEYRFEEYEIIRISPAPIKTKLMAHKSWIKAALSHAV